MKEIPESLKPYEEYLRSTEKPALEITFERSDTLPWESKIGGYPLFVQQSPEYYDDGEYDTLLLQLDCEDECGIMFGDAGNCFFLISKEDLKNRRFDRVEYGWQCC